MIQHFSDFQDQLVQSKKKSLHSIFTALSLGRSLLYIFESLPLTLMDQFLKNQKTQINKQTLKKMQQIFEELYLLIQKDSDRISSGIYPSKVLSIDEPYMHFLRILQIWYKGYQLSKRKNGKRSKDLSISDSEYLKDIPEFYREHSIFKSGGGYLNPSSALLYEHQIEILFLGAADAMRRLMLAPLKSHFRFSEGEGLRFLELGCGTGRFTSFLKMAFPRAKITCLDLSYPYLKEAQTRLKEFERIDFIQGDVSDLPFKGERFDAVLSCFLFHELPLDIRRRSIQEAYRVLHPGGVFGVVDTLQYDDSKELNWAFQLFQNIEDLTFDNYLKNSLEGMLKNQNFQDLSVERGFVSKSILCKKPNVN